MKRKYEVIGIVIDTDNAYKNLTIKSWSSR